MTRHFILAFKTLITCLLMCKANIFLSPYWKGPCLEDQPGLSVSAAVSHIGGLLLGGALCRIKSHYGLVWVSTFLFLSQGNLISPSLSSRYLLPTMNWGCGCEGDSHPSWETEEGVTPRYMGQAGDTNRQ